MNALEELIEPRDVVDRRYVERRVDDWRRRIEDLYARVRAWLPEGWVAAEGGSVSLHEELMQRFDVPAVDLPILSLGRRGAMHGRLEPRGLWIVGTNGRVDLILPESHFLFVDRSESFEDPDWRVAPIHARRDQKPLSMEVVQDILA